LTTPQRHWLVVGYGVPAALWAALGAKLILVTPTLGCCGDSLTERWTVTASIAAVIWLALPTWWLRSRDRLLATAALNTLATLVILADVVHARFFGDPTSVSELIDAWQLPSVASSILASLRSSDVVLFIDVVAVGVWAIVSRYFTRSSPGDVVPRWVRSTAILTAWD
jgi:hypothetical protein